jgi:serine/threonine protein kinase/regulator of sirC expression with transglutaminase-like and TPR domain
MDPNDACPEPSRLHSLLAGTLTGGEELRLVEHIDRCPRCREQLDRQAASSDPIGDWKPVLSEPTTVSPELARVLDGLKRNPPVSQPATERQSGPTTVRENLDLGVAGREWAERNSPTIPASIGPYELVEQVGVGGMGVVYKAVDRQLNRVVAVKVLSQSLASSPLAKRRFIREAQAAAAVCHEHVVTIHAVAEDGGLPYLVMQYVAGQSLQDKLNRQGPLGLKEVSRIGMQVAAGLAAAHAQGLVHRDVKPANVLLENGVERAKITDFGLARAVSDARLTDSGVVVGTPQYMAPEQARGERTDHRSDLFSLGSLLYAMTTGEAPFEAESTVAVLRKVSDEAPRAVRELNPEAPVWLVRIIEKLMNKDPAQRFQTAAEVAELLGSRLAELQRTGGVASEPEPSSPPWRGRAVRWLVCGVLLAGMVAAAVVLVMVSLSRRESTVGATASGTPSVPKDPAGSPPGPVAAAPLKKEPVPGPKELDPNWLLLGQAAFERKEYSQAADYFSEVLRREPHSGRALLKRGDSRAFLRDYAGALADYEELIRLQPKNAAAIFGRAGVECDVKQFDRALADMEETLRLDPKMIWAYFGRARVHAGLKHWERAIADYNTFLAELPDFAPAYQGRAMCNASRGDVKAALPDMDRVVRMKPDAVGSRHYRAWLRARLGDYDGAIADYSRLLHDDPNAVDKLCDRASAYALAGRYQEAEADFTASLSRAGKNPWPLLRRAHNLHARRGDYDRAIADCDAMIAVNPNIAEAYFYRGLALLSKGENARAAADFDHVFELDQPESLTFQGEMRLRYPELHDARANARERLGDLEGAKADRAAADRLRATQSPRSEPEPTGSDKAASGQP